VIPNILKEGIIMKRQLIFTLLFIASLFISCTAFFNFDEQNISHLDKDGNVIKGGSGGIDYLSTTKVIFNNSANYYKVDVFSTHTRNNKMATINAGQISDAISWFADEAYPFYLTYYLSIAGVDIQFIPSKYGLHFIEANITKNIDNVINIVNLDVIQDDEILFNEIYIILKNNFHSGIEFLINDGPQQPINNVPRLINSQATAVFRINNPGMITQYRVRAGTNFLGLNTILPDGIESGWLYEIEVNGVNPVVSLTNEPKPLTLADFR